MSDPTPSPAPGDLKPVPAERRGFLPIHTNGFDRGFIAVVLFIAIHLFWMRVLEQSLPLVVATVISVVLGFVIIRKG
ncbi:DUF2160 family membrane protein [Methylobrevis pamukkalensis]|uniref:DUF2160 domain-containing protein n=1 Tax=Methylobrevis pamukkalensis TaxID=1439726 RepID=A0A1E3GNK9_9HYPH|nr:DUF2160 family membrane protein [Methylobrevis pamukkalensis]ODN65628.1 hypothetical protein A6302_04508 [Methylobrevis pamukkalensis]